MRVTYNKVIQFESDRRIAEINRVVSALNDIFVNYNEDGTNVSDYLQVYVADQISGARKVTNSDEEWFKRISSNTARGRPIYGIRYKILARMDKIQA